MSSEKSHATSLDAVVVDIEDSSTLLKLYVGRLLKAPGRAAFLAPLAEHAAEIAAAVARLDPSVEAAGRDALERVVTLLGRVSRDANRPGGGTTERILTLQEGIDLLEAQLDHMLQGGTGAAPEVTRSLDRVEAAAGTAQPDAAGVASGTASEVRSTQGGDAAGGAVEAEPSASGADAADDPFDDFALSDDFLEEIMSGFDAALAPDPSGDHAGEDELPEARGTMAFEPSTVEPGPVQLSDAEQEGLKDLFAQIAASYVGPIVDFVGRLRLGPVTNGWIDLCMPAVLSMSRASDGMGFESLRDALGRFEAALAAARQGGRVVTGENRARVLETYQGLAELLPNTFPVAEADAASESDSIILDALLKQIKGVGRVTIARLFAAGLVTLQSYYIADPGDLAAAAGIKPALAERICERFRMYQDVSELADDQSLVYRRLRDLVTDLKAAQFEFKKATLDEWYTHEPSRAKAKARRVRQQTMWRINVALAEVGEVDLLRELKDEIYDKRISRLADLVASKL